MSRMGMNSVFPLVAGAVLVLTSVVSGVTVSSQNAALDDQQAKLSSVTAQVDAGRTETSQLETESSLKDAGGSAARVSEDTKVIRELVGRALTWDSNATYTEARESTMRLYGLAADSAFMTAFLPAAPVNLDSEGNEYPYIDAAGLNSQVGDSKVKLLSVDAVDYTYMVLIDVQAKSSDGLGTAANVATVFVTTDGNGDLSEITGFASTTQPRAAR